MITSISPPYLKPNDTVGIIAPAGKTEPAQLKNAFEIIENWGLKIVRGKHLFAQHGYFAGKDEERLEDLQQMLDNPEVKAIFCIRGGYGLTRIVDEVNLDSIHQHPKWVIGFSDITTLHLKLAQNNMQSVHGIMPIHFDPQKTASSIDNLRAFLFGEAKGINWKSNENNISGSAAGPLVGGNLSILSDSMGTASPLQADDCILFIEEVDEYLYKIDRMLIQLKRAGVFNKLKGLLVGHFTSMKDTKTPFGATLEEIILEKAGKNIPVAFGLPAGHDFPNYALPHNRIVKLEVNHKTATLKF
ncbi:MAG: S66 peptidase family protein [Candidatus Cyclobacteriaceae bacterium M2_1C_046]